jgi:phosphomannomutase
LHKAFPNQPLKAAIAYDCRHNSDTLAKLVADVFSANGIEVYLFSELRPTPELSFAVKHLGCQCGIVLTSHNPPNITVTKYTGKMADKLSLRRRSYYKYYRKLNFNQIKFEANEDLIHYIGAEVDQAFINHRLKTQVSILPLKRKKT